MSEDQNTQVVWRDGHNLFILEDGEFCVACHGHDDLLIHQMPETQSGEEPLKFTVCKPCLDGDGYRNWLAGEFEKALEADPTMEKLPDGKWTKRKVVNQ